MGVEGREVFYGSQPPPSPCQRKGVKLSLKLLRRHWRILSSLTSGETEKGSAHYPGHNLSLKRPLLYS